MNGELADRPYAVATYEALTVYLDVIRPWLIRNMPQDHGKIGTEALVKSSIRMERRHGFQRQLDEDPADLARALDVAHIADVVVDNWDPAFSGLFGDDKSYRNKMNNLAKRRNLVCHPGHHDLTKNQADSAFSCIKKIAKHIGRDDAVEKILEIEQRLSDRINGTVPEPAAIDTEVIARYEARIAALTAHADAISADLRSHLAECPTRNRGRVRRLLRRIVPRITVSFGLDDDDQSREANPVESPASGISDAGNGVTDRAVSAIEDAATVGGSESSSNGSKPDPDADASARVMAADEEPGPPLYEPSIDPADVARRNGAATTRP